MRIEWLPEALRNRETQLAYIGEHDPAAAIHMGDATEAAVVRLAAFPESACPRAPGTRECVATGTPSLRRDDIVYHHGGEVATGGGEHEGVP